MAKKYKNKVILAKLETSYGTDASPAGDANAILFSEVSITPMEADENERDLVGSGLGGKPVTLGRLRVVMTGKVELAGAGKAGDVPAYGVLLRACGFAQSANTTAKTVAYQPLSANYPSLSIYYNIDGTLHKMLGARGTVTLEITAGAIPVMNFTFTGLYVDPTDVALPTADLAAFKAPVAVSDANTPTFSLGGFAAVCQSLTLDIGNEVVHRDLINKSGVYITDRRGTGSVVVEAPGLATKDFFKAAKDGTTGALQLIHGVGAGKVVQIDAPKVQALNPSYSEESGIAMLNMNLRLIPNGRDDELVITVK